MSCKLKLMWLVILNILLKGWQCSPFYQFHYQEFMIPHPQKAHRGGQDAYFASSQVLIVADGVGGWNNYGIDPSKYSRFLCSRGGQLFIQNAQLYRKKLVELIADVAMENQNIGSSTMVALTIQGSKLRTCYIGDSGFVILRFNEWKQQYSLFHEFTQQQHQFNFPYQLARKDYNGDDPYQSICQQFELIQNDLIIVGSDGLFDNVYVDELLELVNKVYDDEEKLFALAQKWAKTAIERGQDTRFWSPFAKRAKQHKLQYRGGKLDDTTVIISKLRRTDQEKIVADQQKIEEQTNDSNQGNGDHQNNNVDQNTDNEYKTTIKDQSQNSTAQIEPMPNDKQQDTKSAQNL